MTDLPPNETGEGAPPEFAAIAPPAIEAGNQMLKGSIWMVALRWAIRLTGVVSTVILARLLSPKDFGVVAVAMIVVGMFEMLSATGQGQAIIRHRNPTRAHYDSAWTISALIGIGITIAIIAAAPLTKIYFHDGRTVLVMQCLSLRALLSGVENIGTIDFQRDLTFGRQFGYLIYARMFSFITTIILAFWLRNYWALVAGMLAGQAGRTILSYTMHKYRPRISFAEMRDIWGFSIWSFCRSIGTYFMSQVDTIAVGGITDPSAMGRYTVAKDVASSPTDEISAPIIGVLFPVMAKCQHDIAQMKELYLRTLGWSAIIGVSTSIGILMVSTDLVAVILGSKWIGIAPLMGWLAATAGVAVMADPGFTVLDVLGKPHIGARMQWFRAAILAIAIFPLAYLTRNLATIAIARFAMTLVFVPSLLFTIGRRIDVDFSAYVEVFWRPMVAGAALGISVYILNSALPFSGIVRMGLDVCVGVAAFSGAILSLWIVSGKPASAEQDLLRLLSKASQMVLAIRARGLNAAQ